MNDDVATPDVAAPAAVPHSALPDVAVPEAAVPDTGPQHTEARGCLFALSQPPLMLFLAVIGVLLLFTALYDLSR